MSDASLSLLRDSVACRSVSSDAFRVLFCLCEVGPERIRYVRVLRFLSGIPKPVRCLRELQSAGLLSYQQSSRRLSIRLGTVADFAVWRNMFAADGLLPLERSFDEVVQEPATSA